MSRIVCIGECMVELAPADGGLYRRGFAGDTFNAAWYLRRALPAAWAVDYVTCIGADGVSDEMLAFIADAGIGTGGVARVPDRTVGLYMISLKDGERSFTYWRSASAARMLAADAGRLDRQLAGAGIVLFSGITVAILPPADRATLFAAMGRARAAGATIVFDPNIRPRLWEDRDAARTGIGAGAEVSTLILPSFDDEASLFGDTDPDATIVRYRASGAGGVIVKNGPGEIVGWTERDGRVAYQPPRVQVVDTTAAGDSFNAGLLAAVALGAPLADALVAGARLAGHVCRHPGALVAGEDAPA